MQYPDSAPHWRRYLRFWQPNIQADIDDEIRFHFDARIEELVAQSVAADEAYRRAVEEFGDVNAVTRELRDIDDLLARRRGRADRLDGLRQDVTFAARSLRGSPGMVAAIVVTLALGLGVNTAVFSLLDSIFLRPPAGVLAPGRVRRLWTEINLGSGKQYWPGYAYPQYRAVTEALTGLAETAIFLQPAPTKLGVGGTTLPITMSRVSSGYFPLLGVRASMGRFFTADEDRLGAGARVAVVSHALSQRALGGDASALGRAIVLGGERYTVIGIAALDFRGVDLDATDVWVPVATFDGNGPNPWWLGTTINGFSILLRPKEHVGDEAIEARATAVLRRPGMSLIGDNLSVTTRLGSIVRARGPGRPAQVVEIATRLGGVAVIVLLIACANVVNLLLARAVRRRREIALRLALGISRARLVRLLMIESLILAVAAGAAAILAAYWGGGALRSILLPDVHWPQSPLDWRVLVAAVVATFAAGSIAGLIPALQSASMTLTDALKTGAREGYAHRSALRSLLVMAQAALSVVLLVGAALFVQSLKNVRSLDLGFETSRLLFARVDFESKDTGRDSLVPARLTELAGRFRGTAGVEGTALTTMRPIDGFTRKAYFPDADTIANKKPMGLFWAVSSDYFATTGTRLVGGQLFPNVHGATMPASVIVNDAMARALWPGQNPIGRCIRFDKADGRCNTVIGVVETAHWGRVIEDPTPQFYLPLENMPFEWRGAHEIAIRASDGAMASVIREVRTMLKEAFPSGDPVITPMSAALEPQYRPWRLGATLFSLFGILALVVAAVGIYSTVSYYVNERTQEFGIRVALGARLGDVVAHVLGAGLRTVAIGVLVGVGGALAAGRLVASLLYGIAPSNVWVIATVAVVLLLVAAIAALGPAWRAARVDPMSALRLE